MDMLKVAESKVLGAEDFTPEVPLPIMRHQSSKCKMAEGRKKVLLFATS